MSPDRFRTMSRPHETNYLRRQGLNVKPCKPQESSASSPVFKRPSRILLVRSVRPGSIRKQTQEHHADFVNGQLRSQRLSEQPGSWRSVDDGKFFHNEKILKV